MSTFIYLSNSTRSFSDTVSESLNGSARTKERERERDDDDEKKNMNKTHTFVNAQAEKKSS